MDRSAGGVVELEGTRVGSGVGPGLVAGGGVRRSGTGPRPVGPRPVRPAAAGERVAVLRRGVAVGAAAGGPGGVRLLETERWRRGGRGTWSQGVAAPARPSSTGAPDLRRRAVQDVPGRSGPVTARRYALRRAVAAAVLGLASMLVVVGLGLVGQASGAAHTRAEVPSGVAAVVVEPGETVWDLARREVPEADAAAVVERIVADNGLGSAAVGVLPAGTVVRVPA
ncbi:hypothetical protein [Pseudonocardia sp. WMMC193]|uniref:hypothetical protein n=1 Tax=Pseudonocardia sp. WMMC193 TaxID=2911965 RepID=UPI001F466568|nr:hypothetical protein [Pseudonocardia sp. WMMC193]MCF7549983.1 hypothetical protein [Pseudonocardia sp. WMMC193]